MNSRNLNETLRKNPNARIILPDDQYERFINSTKLDASERIRVVSEGSITGNHDSLALQQEKLSGMTENIQEFINQSEQQRNYSLRQKIFSDMNKAAPYAGFGALKSLSENWEILNNAFSNKTTWSKALTRSGADFGGYTLGVSLWEAGREYLAYTAGEIQSKEFYRNITHITARTVEEVIPVNVIIYLVSCTGYTIPVPVAVFAGQQIIQRVHSWFDEKRLEKIWLETIYPDEIKTMLGEDLINLFTIINPETRHNLANPETRPSLAEPLTRPSLAK